MAKSFIPKMLYSSHLFTLLQRSGNSTLPHFFLYCNVAFFFMSCASAFLIKHSSVRYSRRKKQLKCRAWGQESAHISVIARVRNSGSLFQSFLYAFRQGAGSCPHQWVSVIATYRQGESRLYLVTKYQKVSNVFKKHKHFRFMTLLQNIT